MGENKVLDLPDQEEDEDEDEPAPEEADAEDDSDNEKGEIEIESSSSSNNISVNIITGPSSSEPQPGTSSGIQNGAEKSEDETNENLQFAWEALEMAAKVFRRLGASHEEYLAEAHLGLGEILMENQNCSEAIRDYSELFLAIFSNSRDGEGLSLVSYQYITSLLKTDSYHQFDN